jgi:hypothetical protein
VWTLLVLPSTVSWTVLSKLTNAETPATMAANTRACTAQRVAADGLLLGTALQPLNPPGTAARKRRSRTRRRQGASGQWGRPRLMFVDTNQKSHRTANTPDQETKVIKVTDQEIPATPVSRAPLDCKRRNRCCPGRTNRALLGLAARDTPFKFGRIGLAFADRESDVTHRVRRAVSRHAEPGVSAQKGPNIRAAVAATAVPRFSSSMPLTCAIARSVNGMR